MNNLTDNQQAQEEQYKFPYHYADLFSDRHKYFKFIEPMDLLGLVKGKVNLLNKTMILDAGCGDGRLCYELKNENNKIVGIDYSSSAIAFARAFNPEVDFYVQDLKSIDIPHKFDIIILMEVLEHFIPEHIDQILKSLSNVLVPEGRLLISVPTTNMKVSEKHYQHFNPGTLARAIESHFLIEEVTGYGKKGLNRFVYKKLRSLGSLLYPFRKSSIAQKYFNYLKNYYKRKVSTGLPHECNGILAVCRKAA